MSIFYHISQGLFHDGKFYPRIPMDRTEGEDEITKRVSVAPTIKDCLSAIPGGGMKLDETITEIRGYFKVFKINTEKLGISKEHIVDGEYLFQTGKVPDAYHTNEHWITKEFEVPKEDTFIIKIDSYFEEVHDLIPHEIYELAEEKYEGDYIEAYFDVHEKRPSCITCITEINYYTNFLKEGQKIEIMLDYWDDEKEELKAVIQGRFKSKLRLIDECDSRLTCEAVKDCDIRGLFLHHYKFVN